MPSISCSFSSALYKLNFDGYAAKSINEKIKGQNQKIIEYCEEL